MSQRVLELSDFKSEAEVKLKDTIDLEQKSIELEERVHQLTRVSTLYSALCTLNGKIMYMSLIFAYR